MDTVETEDFFVNFMSSRVKNTIHIFGEGIGFASKAFNAQEKLVSEKKELMDELVNIKRGQNGRK